MTDDDYVVLARCHELIGVEVRRGTAVSLSEAAGLPDLDVTAAIDSFRTVVTAPATPR
jgi:hypothetical protein